MPGRTKPPYPAAFRQQMIELVKAGRSPEELLRNWPESLATPHKVFTTGSVRPVLELTAARVTLLVYRVKSAKS